MAADSSPLDGRTSTVTVTVNVNDLNDVIPIFPISQYSEFVLEEQTFIDVVQVTVSVKRYIIIHDLSCLQISVR